MPEIAERAMMRGKRAGSLSALCPNLSAKPALRLIENRSWPMAVTITLYNHTAKRFAEGSNGSGDTYKLKLYSALTPSAAHTTLAAVDAAGTEATAGTGYTSGGQALSNVAVTTVTTNDAKFDADDVTWTASGGSIAAAYGVIYNDTDADDPPVAYIDFDGTQTAGDGTDFIVSWNASGIVTFTVA